MKLWKDAKVYEHYNTDRYMFAFGLSVNPLYRGHKLGAHILSVRWESIFIVLYRWFCPENPKIIIFLPFREQIGREYKIDVTATIFSGPLSQKSAANCGFEDLLAVDYDQILDEEGKEIFPGIKFKTLKVMGKRLYWNIVAIFFKRNKIAKRNKNICLRQYHYVKFILTIFRYNHQTFFLDT